MENFDKYLQKYPKFDRFIQTPPSKELLNVIVIPAYAEPDILKTLNSLLDCKYPKKPVEIIVVLNSPENAESDSLNLNKLNEDRLKIWANQNNTHQLKLHVIHISNIPRKTAGAGYARKIGMDEAVRRLYQAGSKNGFISSLDADALVSKNYLTELENLFYSDIKCNGCSIFFQHPLNGAGFSKAVYKTITEYELHLRYYRLALIYTGFPYFNHTVGSSFAVRAETYCKQGGMNTKQAGEDFYFLHKIIPLGHFNELNSTTVYPSPRPSDRVPFGTGAAIAQYAVHEKKEFLTYDFDAFVPLKELFADKEIFYKKDSENIEGFISKYPGLFLEFLNKNNFLAAMNEINANTSNLNSFIRRFFQWFDAFRIMKYLNYAHVSYFKKQKVIPACLKCLDAIGKNPGNITEPFILLEKLRKMEKT
jgi:hypothetical protein